MTKVGPPFNNAPDEVDPEDYPEAHYMVMACRNHPKLRWIRKNPVRMRNMISQNMQLMFKGEVNLSGDIVKPLTPYATDPFHYLKCRIEGKNPFDASLSDSQFTTWEEVVDFVRGMEDLSEKYAFECQCKFDSLYYIGPSD